MAGIAGHHPPPAGALNGIDASMPTDPYRKDGSTAKIGQARNRLRKWSRWMRLDGLLKRFYVQGRMIGERPAFLVRGRPAAHSAIVLAGSGRSGTTWVADVLTAGSRLQQIYEPLHPSFIRKVRHLTGFDERDPYLRLFYRQAHSDDPAWYDFWYALLTGRVRNHWTDHARTAWFPDRFLIKTIRSHLMLGYVYDNFRPWIIYLTRHPCAVVYSRLHKVEVPWHASVSDILCQEALVEDYLHPWVGAIERERDILGAHAVWWAVENMVAQRELATRRHYAATYEALVLDPEREIRALFEYLGLDGAQLSAEQLVRPSRMATRGTFIRSSAERLREWQHKLTASEQHRILEWAHRLGVCSYNEQVLPAGFSEAS